MRFFIPIILLSIFLTGCVSETETFKEPWADKPLSQWPNFALTNDVTFEDTTFKQLANTFLVNTGIDTIAVSCKHIFLVFENPPHVTSIDLGEQFKNWTVYPKNKHNKTATISMLINTNHNEPIGRFNTLKDRDWIILGLIEKNKEIFPLKIRYTPVEKHEIIFAVGWGALQEDNRLPAISKLQCYKNMGNYYYVKTLTQDVAPNGRSGSPVIDKNGFLVGIISGAEGNLGVMGSVQYLKELFDEHEVPYRMQYN